MLTFQRIDINDKTIALLGKLRYDAYAIDFLNFTTKGTETYYSHELKNKKYLVYGAYLANELVAACYISDVFNSLYIEQIFVKKSLQYDQENNLHIGSNLLKFVLNDRFQIEEYFEKKFQVCKLSPVSKAAQMFYEKMGFKLANEQMDIFEKKI